MIAPTPLRRDKGVAALVGQLVDDSRGLVSAEVALYKAKAGERIAAYKSAAVFFAVAGVLVLTGLIALLVGLILSLAPLIGPWGATAVVVGVVFVLAVIAALIGKRRLAKPQELA